MSFLRHQGIYRYDRSVIVRGRQRTLPPSAHRVDEFPTGYSWRVALQQSPLPLHRSRLILIERSVDGKNFLSTQGAVS